LQFRLFGDRSQQHVSGSHLEPPAASGVDALFEKTENLLSRSKARCGPEVLSILVVVVVGRFLGGISESGAFAVAVWFLFLADLRGRSFTFPSSVSSVRKSPPHRPGCTSLSANYRIK